MISEGFLNYGLCEDLAADDKDPTYFFTCAAVPFLV